MDLLEIRKKARGLKAEEDEAKKAAGSVEHAGPDAADEAAPPPEDAAVTAEGVVSAGHAEAGTAEAAPAPKPKKKKAAAKRKKVEAPEPVPEAEPEPDAELGDMFLTLSEDVPFAVDDAEAGTEDAPEGPGLAEPPVWDQPPADEPPPPPAHTAAHSSDDVHDEGGDAGDALVEYLAFRVGSEEYAVKVEDVREIIRLQKITDVPRAPGFVKGIISLRGVIIPIFDIKNRLGFEEAENTRSTRIVVVAEEGMPQGIIVDKVTGVVRFPAKTIEPPPAVIGGVEAEYMQGVGRMGDRLLILLNTGRILAMEG